MRNGVRATSRAPGKACRRARQRATQARPPRGCRRRGTVAANAPTVHGPDIVRRAVPLADDGFAGSDCRHAGSIFVSFYSYDAALRPDAPLGKKDPHALGVDWPGFAHAAGPDGRRPERVGTLTMSIRSRHREGGCPRSRAACIRLCARSVTPVSGAMWGPESSVTEI
ncbi:hypothetical protein BLAT2472_20872 [Burkholderia latens]